MHQPDRRRVPWLMGSPGVWWISPIGAVALICPLTLVVAWRISDSTFEAQYLAPKVLTRTTVATLAMSLVAIAAGAGLSLVRRGTHTAPNWPAVDSALIARLRRFEPVIFGLTIAGYVLFAALAVVHGLTLRLLLQAIVAQDSNADNPKGAFGSVTGLTSLTQIGMAYAVVATLLLTAGRNRRVSRRLVLLITLALVRSYLDSERLAVIEVTIPVLVIGVSWLAMHGTGTRRLVARSAPLILFPILFVGFGALEYSRSYAYYGPRTHESLVGFAFHRLTGYYVSSINNGQLALDYDRFPGRLPFALLQGFWSAPGVAQLGGYTRATGVDHAALWIHILTLHGNPEYNSPGGLSAPFVDLGTVGGFVFFVVLGLVLGALYRGYLRGGRLGLLVYPSLVTGIFELPRYLYWTEGRFLPSLAVLLLLALPTTERAPVPTYPVTSRPAVASDRRRVTSIG